LRTAWRAYIPKPLYLALDHQHFPGYKISVKRLCFYVKSLCFTVLPILPGNVKKIPGKPLAKRHTPVLRRCVLETEGPGLGSHAFQPGNPCKIPGNPSPGRHIILLPGQNAKHMGCIFYAMEKTGHIPGQHCPAILGNKPA